jgi:hypothetical protein
MVIKVVETKKFGLSVFEVTINNVLSSTMMSHEHAMSKAYILKNRVERDYGEHCVVLDKCATQVWSTAA